jgi:hypothetical protein
MILFEAELQFMNGEVRANIHVRRMSENHYSSQGQARQRQHQPKKPTQM